MEQSTLIALGIISLIGLFAIYCIFNIILSIKRNKLLKGMQTQNFEKNIPEPIDYEDYEQKQFEYKKNNEPFPEKQKNPAGYTFNPKKYREQRQQENMNKSTDEVDVEWEEYQRKKHETNNFKYNM